MAPIEEGGDFGQSHSWSEQLRTHLTKFRQGHIIPDIPIFFGSLGADPLWNNPRERLDSNRISLTVEAGGVLHRAMILTQGCDVALPKTPWVTVAPVYDAKSRLTPDQQRSVRAGSTRYLVPITAQWSEGSLWVADLRLELPIEKTALLTREPLEAFTDSQDYPRLAERLAVNRQRPDIPDTVLESLVKPLFDTLRDRAGAEQSLLTNVRELRIHLDNPLAPSTVTLFVITYEEAPHDLDSWAQVMAAVYPSMESAGLTLVGPELVTLETLPAQDYLTSSPIEDARSS